jgi:hypothetical protein
VAQKHSYSNILQKAVYFIADSSHHTCLTDAYWLTAAAVQYERQLTIEKERRRQEAAAKEAPKAAH